MREGDSMLSMDFMSGYNQFGLHPIMSDYYITSMARTSAILCCPSVGREAGIGFPG